MQSKTTVYEYPFGFTYCLSAKVMKEAELYFRFDDKTDTIMCNLLCLICSLYSFDFSINGALHKSIFILAFRL